MSTRTCIIVPAREGSRRFPGKPVNAIINGRSLIERVWRLGVAVAGVSGVFIATDSELVAGHVRGFGGRVLMTSPDAATGTDRVHEALQQLGNEYDAVVNLQGDAPLTPPWVIEALFRRIGEPDCAPIVTPAVELSVEQLAELQAAKASAPASGTTVVVSSSGRALYFSKNILPYRRDNYPIPVLRHIGLYAYKRAALDRIVAIQPTPLEQAEGLEQLRALESDMPIEVVRVDYRGRTHHSIDHPNDVAIAEDIIAREGELLP